MARGGKNDYYAMLHALVGYSCRAAELLDDFLADFSPDKLSKKREEIHLVEQEADAAKHELLMKLTREFITPIDMGDILRLTEIIDDVTDGIDEVSINLYMFNVSFIPEETRKLSRLVLRCTKALQSAVEELRNYKRSSVLHERIVEVNNLENEADQVYIEAMRILFTSHRETLAVLAIREIYDCLEHCCDLCEHGANVLENVVMKNS